MKGVIKYAVGCDIDSKKIVTVMVGMDQELMIKIRGSRTFANTASGRKALLAWVDKKRKEPTTPVSYVMEATGNYYESLAYLLHEANERVSVVLANKARKYMQSLGLNSKNDSIDARGLAQMGAQQQLECWKPVSDYCYDLKKLTRQRQHLQEHITLIKNQLFAENYSYRPHKDVVKQQQKLLKTYELLLKDLDKKIKTTLAKDPEFERKVLQIANSIKGLGWLSVLVVVAECNGFALFNNVRQLTSFAGYDVLENQSGKRAGKTRMSKMGNAHIRRTLYFPAINVVRHRTGWFYQFHYRILKRTTIYKKANVAVQRKLLCLIYALWKKNEAFVQNYPYHQESISLSPLSPSPEAPSSAEGQTKSSPQKQATQDEHQYAEAPEALFPL